MEFQIYEGNNKKSAVIGTVSLDYWLKAQKQPKPHIVETCKKIDQAVKDGNKKLKKELKDQLPGCTPAVHVTTHRRKNCIQSFTGIAQLDIDDINHAPALKQYLFDTYPCIIAAWLSVSKRGVKCFVSIPLARTIEDFRAYMYGLCAEFSGYKGFDPITCNPVQVCYYSHDPDLLRREKYTVWTEKGFQVGQQPTQTTPKPNIEVLEWHTKATIKIINTGFANIKGNGHPQLRSLCRSVGGYVASGYISANDAIQQINYCIENNKYLKNDGAGTIPGYKKTALSAMNDGQRSPLTLESLN